ncbi:MAG: universal protein YeaZ, partial [Pseudonocardia sp.]|nr:universal protein YeaZ [Pseudonocardia sp.]
MAAAGPRPSPGRTLDYVLLLALDTSTPTVVAGLVELPAESSQPRELAARHLPGGRQHGELLMPAVLAVCDQAGRSLAELDALVCGTGPGPFTGLRVGMVTAAALGDALGVPVYGVCSLDGIAAAAGCTGPLLVATDARRRELYWAAYDVAGERVAGPNVDNAAVLAGHLEDLRPLAAAGAAAAGLGLPVLDVDAPTPAGLVTVAAAEL